MSFNPDPSKQVHKIIFRKKKDIIPPECVFEQYSDQCNFSVQLSSEICINNVKKTIGLLRKFQQSLPRQSVITIYKWFIQAHLEYVDIVCDGTVSESFHKKLKSIHDNAAIVITGTIRDTFSGKLFKVARMVSLKLVFTG